MGERCVQFHLYHVKHMWFGVSKTSRIIGWHYGGPENATKHTMCDIARARGADGVGDARALRGSRSVERARQHKCSTDTCTRHSQLRSELRQSSPATLHSSRWQADGDLRCVTDSHVRTGRPGSGCKACACERAVAPARAIALAVQEGHPCPVPRPGPSHGMGRAARCRAHALTGLAGVQCATPQG